MTVLILAGLLNVAAEQVPAQQPAPWTTWAPTIVVALIAAAAAVFGTLGAVRVKKLNRGVDDATVLKTHVEAEKLRAETEKTRVESEGREVEIARGLLDDIRKELDRYRQEAERDRQRYAEQVADVVATSDKRYQELSNQLTEVQAEQQDMRERLDAHLPWDDEAHSFIVRTNPDFPAPPPLDKRR